MSVRLADWPRGLKRIFVVELPKGSRRQQMPESKQRPSGAWQFVIPDQLILLQNAFSQKRCLLLLQVEAGDVILRVNEVDVNRFSTKEGKKTDLLFSFSFSLFSFLSLSLSLSLSLFLSFAILCTFDGVHSFSLLVSLSLQLLSFQFLFKKYHLFVRDYAYRFSPRQDLFFFIPAFGDSDSAIEDDRQRVLELSVNEIAFS